jgi:hypothetical protein
LKAAEKYGRRRQDASIPHSRFVGLTVLDHVFNDYAMIDLGFGAANNLRSSAPKAGQLTNASASSDAMDPIIR